MFMSIIPYRKIWFTVSSLLVILSIAALSIWGVNFGIDFTGGSALEVEFQGERPGVTEVKEKLAGLDLTNLVIKPVEEQGMILRFQQTSDEVRADIMEKLGDDVTQLRFDALGPSY